MKTLEMRENHRKLVCIYKTTHISAVINYKFSNFVPNQGLDNFVLFCHLVSKLSNIKKACMLMKPLKWKQHLQKNKGRHLQNFYYLSC